MNPLKSITGTLVSGLVLALIIVFLLRGDAGGNPAEWTVWFHVVVGIIWIGLLYYFNFVQVPGMAVAKADGTAAGISKHIAPRALLWFRWAAVLTWLSGLSALAQIGGGMQGIINAFMFADGMAVIGMGAWLGTIMLFNVWVLIWPNQKKVLGLVDATDEQKAKAGFVALMASRTNTMLSIPMLLGMTAYAHGLPF